MGGEIPLGVSEWHVGEGAALRMTHQTGDAPTGGYGTAQWMPVHVFTGGGQALRGENGWGWE